MGPETPLRRDVAVILIGGAVLGLFYNGIGLATRPPRGIPWVTKQEAPPTLESLTGPDSAQAVAGMPPAIATGGSEPPGIAAPAAPAPVTRGSGAHPAPASSGAAPGAGSPPATRPDPGTTTSSGTAALPDPRPAIPLPFIPNADQPIQAQVATVKRFFDARGALFLDARDPAEYEKGHIPGAIRLTNAEAQSDPERLKTLPVEGRPIIAYCEGGSCESSLELARFLIESGYKKVLVYMGGFPEWEAAGHPVERGSGGR